MICEAHLKVISSRFQPYQQGNHTKNMSQNKHQSHGVQMIETYHEHLSERDESSWCPIAIICGKAFLVPLAKISPEKAILQFTLHFSLKCN